MEYFPLLTLLNTDDGFLENIVWKEAFSPFPIVFSKGVFSVVVQSWDVW